MSRFDFFKKALDILADDIPDDYLCVDLETTGFTFDFLTAPDQDSYVGDLIVEVGFCDAENHFADYYENRVLNWLADGTGVKCDWLENKFRLCTDSMAKRGRVYRMSVDKMTSEGEDPREIIVDMSGRVATAIAEGKKLVGFNIFDFDRRVITDVTAEWCGEPLYIPDESVFDVGLLEKANQLDMLPYVGEAAADFFKRVKSVYAKGVYWNLDACVERYQLQSLYDFDGAETHNAGTDAMVTHLIFREMLGI